MNDQQQVRNDLTAQGYGVISPPMGDALYERGGEYRDANGAVVNPPAEPTPDASDVLIDLALVAIGDMTTGELAKIVMGREPSHDVLSKALDGNTDEFLSEYTDAKIKAYVSGQGVDVGDVDRAGLLQLVEALHA